MGEKKKAKETTEPILGLVWGRGEEKKGRKTFQSWLWRMWPTLVASSQLMTWNRVWEHCITVSTTALLENTNQRATAILTVYYRLNISVFATKDGKNTDTNLLDCYGLLQLDSHATHKHNCPSEETNCSNIMMTKRSTVGVHPPQMRCTVQILDSLVCRQPSAGK